MTVQPIPPLTPAAVADLRSGKIITPPLWGGPYMVAFEGFSSLWSLMQYTGQRHTVICRHADPQHLLALVAGERASPGFVETVFDTSLDPEAVLLDPEGVARVRRLRAEGAAKARADAAAQAEANRRRLTHLTIPKEQLLALTLDDLLSP